MCCTKKRHHLNALMNTTEHWSHSGISNTLENSPALLQLKGFILSKILTSGRKRMRVALTLLQLPSLLAVTGPAQWNKTQYFSSKEKYTHGTASGGFLKFKGKWKGWWLPPREQLLHLQFTGIPTGKRRCDDKRPWATCDVARVSHSIALQN